MTETTTDTSTETEEQEEIPALGSIMDYLNIGREYECSDIHLSVNCQPTWRRFGVLQPIWDNSKRLVPADTERYVKEVLTDKQWELLKKRGDVDFAYMNEGGRFRVSVVRQRLGLDLVFRLINSEVRSMDELGLPDALRVLTKYHNGLILVTGSVGSGKSTTMASMVNEVNKERTDHIITLEEPIEILFEPLACHVNQREVGLHTVSFATALRAALREDPDIIMIGEMRDLETISLAITAAETGHLVIGTLHTGSAARTLDRVLDVFPVDQRDQIRIMVAESLRGVISQQLVPTVDGTGRVLAMEILINTPAVANCIREGKTYMLGGVMQTGRNIGMVTMDDSLRALYDKGKITQEECMSRAEDKATMRAYFKS